MNISATAVTASIGTPAPTLPTGSTRQAAAQDDTSNQVQDKVRVGHQSSGTKAANADEAMGAPTPVIQDPQQTTKTDDKKQDKDQPASKEQVEKAVSSVNDYIQKLRHRALEFSMDDKSGRMVIKIMDSDTKETIRQIPSEEMLRLADNLGKSKGWLLEQKT